MRVARVVGSAVFATGLAVIVSCAQVIGAGDYHVGQTSGGDGGTACTSSSVDTSVLVPAISACVLLWGCFPYEPTAQSQRLSDCVTFDSPAAFPTESCARTAQSCADIEKCLGYAYATPQDCPTKGAFCNGSRAANCSDAGSGAVRRCDVLNGTCKTYASGGSTVAGCEVVPSCTDKDQANHCNQNALYGCVGGVGYGQQCGANATCKTVDTTTSCYDKAPSCTLPGDHCEGDVFVECTKGGDTYKFDCSSVGLSCQETTNDAGTSSPSCLAAGCTADDQTHCTESCDGTTANLCIGGAPIGIACTDFGMTSCRTYQATDSNNVTKTFAYCRPY
jgi:hypothetical protein